MRMLVLSTAMTGILLGGTGCSTLQHPLETKAWIEKNEKSIKSGVALVRRIAVRHLAQNPEEQARVNAQIDFWAFQVQVLLANGETSPDALAEALGIKEEWAASVIDALLLLYRDKYDELVARDQAQLALVLLRAIVDGLAPVTPTSTVE